MERNDMEFETMGRTFLVSCTPVFSKNGLIDKIIHIATDITERKKAEEALRKSEEEYRNIFENANEAIFVVQDGKLVFINPMTAMITGYSREELIARPFAEFIHPDDRDMVIDRHVRRIKGEELPQVYSFRIINRDGNIIWGELNVVLINWKDKSATLNFLSDITERRQVEEEKRSLEERFRVVFERSNVGKSMTAPDGKLIQINKAFADLLGYTIDEIQLLNFTQITHPDDVAISHECIRVLISGEQTSYRFEKRYIHNNGNIVFTDVSTTLLRDEKGTPLYFITSIMDITERKKAEEQVKQTIESLRKSFGTIIQVMVSAVETRDPPIQLATKSGRQILPGQLPRKWSFRRI
jgi:PAS domain S-box-containing protein